MTDPDYDFNTKTVELNFESSTNWTLTKMRITNTFGTDALLLSPQNYNFVENFEDSLDMSNDWRFNDMVILTDNDDTAIDGQSGEVDSPADSDVCSTRAKTDLNPSGVRRVFTIFFYDDEDEGGGNELWHTCQAAAATPTATGILGIGWDTDAGSPTKYSVVKDTVKSATSVDRSEGWHKVCLSTQVDSRIADDVYKRRVYIDGTQVVNDTNTVPPDAAFGYLWRAYGLTMPDAKSGIDHHIDELIIQSTETDIFEEGTAVIELDFNKVKLKSLDDVTITDNTTGAWTGTTAYQFQHAKNGGAYGALTNLTQANLQALTLGKNGSDKIKITITHTPASLDMSNNAFIPRTTQIVIDFDFYTEEINIY